MSVVDLTLKKQEPVAEIIAECEKLLATAKSGELRELAYVGDHITGWVSYISTTTDRARQIGEIYRLLAHANKLCDRTSAEEVI